MSEESPRALDDRRQVVTVAWVLVLGAALILAQGAMIQLAEARGRDSVFFLSIPSAMLWQGKLTAAEEALYLLGGCTAIAATTWLALTPVVSRVRFARAFLPIGLILTTGLSLLIWRFMLPAVVRNFGRPIALGAAVLQLLILITLAVFHLRWHRSPDGVASRAYALLLQAWLQTTCLPVPWGWI